MEDLNNVVLLDTTQDAVEVEAILMEKIATLANAERVTKTVLGELSRELLDYYQSSGDVYFINCLLGRVDGDDTPFILTPINFRNAVHYFREFVPHASNWKAEKDYVVNGIGKRNPFVFGKKSGNRIKAIGNKLAEWLEDADNNIWVWSKSVVVKGREIDYAKNIVNSITKAMAEDGGNMTHTGVLMAVLEAGVSVADLVDMVETLAHLQPVPGEAA